MKKFLIGLLKVLFVIKEIILIPISVLFHIVMYFVCRAQMDITFKQYVRYQWYALKLAFRYFLEIDDLRLIPDYCDEWEYMIEEYLETNGL